MLLAALLCTLGAKFVVVRELSPLDYLVPFVQIGLPDLIFFCSAAAAFSLASALPYTRCTARLTLMIAVALLIWSILNAMWLIRTGVQLRPDVLRVLAASSDDFWPMVQARLARFYVLTAILIAALVAIGVWFVWRMITPLPWPAENRMLSRRHGMFGIAIAFFAIAQQFSLMPGTVAFSGRVFGYSSHWYALMGLVSTADAPDIHTTSRQVSRVGERRVTLPSSDAPKPPNIVIFLLESVPFAETSMGSPDRNQTPALANFAAEGVEFRRTYVPLPQTTKAFWATFTGSTPEIYHGYAEALLADRPYESIATILKPMGYRSAFFQMSTGTFECLPALFSNLGFDSVWFPEDSKDASARLSALTGDDSRIIGPMFEWIERGEQPFLLTLITSVAHDPFVVPTWFETPAEERADRFRQAIRFTDHVFGEFLRKLEERGLAENTIVCVLGDHGESCRKESKRGRFGLFEEIVRVPWAIRWPGRIEGGLRIETLCSQIDVTPTLLGLLGANIDEAGFDGLNVLQDAPAPRRLHFASWTPNSPLGFVEGSRKIVYWPDADVVFEYDLASDAAEQSPKTIDGPERTAIISDLRDWQQRTQFYVDPHRFREATLFGKWRVFASGRFGRSMYDPPHE